LFPSILLRRADYSPAFTLSGNRIYSNAGVGSDMENGGLSADHNLILRNRSSLTLPVMQASLRFQGRGCSPPRCDPRKFGEEKFSHEISSTIAWTLAETVDSKVGKHFQIDWRAPCPSPWHFRGTAGAFYCTLLHSVAGLRLHKPLNLLGFLRNWQSAKPLVRDS